MRKFRQKETVENVIMQIQNVLISFVVLTSAQVLASGDVPVQPLELKSPLITKTRGNVLSPYSANSKNEVVTLLGFQQAEDIEKQMSFETHRVLLFTWAGSGQDRLDFDLGDGKAIFRYVPGRTRDYRKHQKAFAVNKALTWEVVSF